MIELVKMNPITMFLETIIYKTTIETIKSEF